MGIWFVSTAIGNYFGGLLGGFYDIDHASSFFLLIAAVSACGGVFLISMQITNCGSTLTGEH
jgi:hypothetical protein